MHSRQYCKSRVCVLFVHYIKQGAPKIIRSRFVASLASSLREQMQTAATFTHTHTHTRKHVHTQQHTHNTQTHKHTNTHTHTHTRTYTHKHTYTHMHTHAHTHIHTHTHTNTHTHTHTHTHEHTHTNTQIIHRQELCLQRGWCEWLLQRQCVAVTRGCLELYAHLNSSAIHSEPSCHTSLK